MRALIVDDERLARAELRRLVAAHPSIEIVGEAADGEEALRLVEGLHPDLLFLDVQMPDLDGFQVLERLDDVPEVIFTTAFDKYALKAFEVSALDYLLKPIDPKRLAEALAKLTPPAPTSAPRQVFVKDGDRCWFVKVEDIVLLESEGNYTRLRFGKEKALVLRSLSALEERLGDGFFRAGRRHLVNLRWIEGVAPSVTGGLLLTMRGGHEVEMSRRRAQAFRERMSL